MGAACMHIDIRNGEAAGLCSVFQWRLHESRAARLVNGLKRDIGLRDRLQAGRADPLLVYDLSMPCNLAPLMRLLEPAWRHAFSTAARRSRFPTIRRGPVPDGAQGA
jgi:hypothetical protein